MHIRSIAQSGRALRSGRRGRRFESCYSDQKLNRRYAGFIFGGVIIGFGASSLRQQWPVRKQVDLINAVQSNRHGFPADTTVSREHK